MTSPKCDGQRDSKVSHSVRFGSNGFQLVRRRNLDVSYGQFFFWIRILHGDCAPERYGLAMKSKKSAVHKMTLATAAATTQTATDRFFPILRLTPGSEVAAM